MNAHCERFLRSARTECLDHFLVADEPHMERVLREYAAYFNAARPHQGLGQGIPGLRKSRSANSAGAILAEPVLNALHHDYRRAA